MQQQQQQQLKIYGRPFSDKWNVRRELESADYKIKTENHGHQCPYCGYLNRMRKYMAKGCYSKCEKCEKIFKNRSRKTPGCKQ